MDMLEPARMEDLALYLDIMRAAKGFQREQGFSQWTEDYPSADTIEGDIRSGKGYVLKIGGELAGYMCVDLDGDPDYEQLQGSWGADEPYAVVHRMAFRPGYRGKGLTGTAFRLVEELCAERGIAYLRADTYRPNRRTQHVLEKNGFEYRGPIGSQSSEKLGYDKIIAPRRPSEGQKAPGP